MFGRGKKNEAGKGADGGDGGGDGDAGAEAGDIEMTEQDGKGEQEEGGVGEMKRGDYMVHIFLEKAKDIQCPANDTVDPIFEIACLGQKAYSSAKEKIGGLGEVVWSEHVFIEAANIEKKTAEEGKIKITLQDKGFYKNSVIGMYEFDLSYIYFMKNHVLLHKWLAFSNPNSEKYSEVTGYLKLSINVTCTGDESVQIEDDDGPDDPNVLMPPSLNPKFYQLKLRFFQAQGIPPMDMGMGFMRKAKTDAYVMTQYKKRKLKTSVQVMEEGQTVEWNQELWLPTQIPVISKRLVVKVMDRDDIKDEVVGSLLFDVQKIVDGAYQDTKGTHGQFFWANIYGSPLNLSNSQAKRDMNEDPDLASNWKGRILMQIECYATEKPVSKVENIEDEVRDKAMQYTQLIKYQLIAEVGQAIALPYADKFSVKIVVGGVAFNFAKAKVAKKDYNRFNERIEQTVDLPYQAIEDFESVFVTLIDDEKPICFYKDSITNFMDKDKRQNANTDKTQWDYRWVSFKPDMAVNKVKDANKAGMISFKLAIHRAQDQAYDFKEHPAWRKMPPKRLEPVKIRAYIYQCMDLPAADSNGTSDPFVQVWDMSDGKPKRTQTIEDNNNPLYYEVLELDYEVRDINDLESYPPFILDVFDEDQELMDSSDDYLARAIVEPEECFTIGDGKDANGDPIKQWSISLQKDFEIDRNNEIPARPQWHPLNFMPGEPKCGEILVSFSVSQIDYNYVQRSVKSVDLASRVEFREFDLTMLILGLRGLESPGILPVKKAFIQFNLKSLVPPNSSAIQNVQTQPKNSGSNPTINTTMKVTVPLPTDPLYCPKLSCTVYDYIFKGWNQPMIGVFTMPIGQYMLELIAERKAETDEIEKINSKLDKILKGDDNRLNYVISEDAGDKPINETQEVNDDAPLIEKKIGQQTSEVGLSDIDYQARVSSADLDVSVSSREGSISKKKRTESGNMGPKRRKKRTTKDETMKGAKQTDFVKDASENLGVDADDSEYLAKQAEQERLDGIRERRRTAKSTHLQKQMSTSKTNIQTDSILNFDKEEDAVNNVRKESTRQAAANLGLADEDRQETLVELNQGVEKSVLKQQIKEEREQEKRIESNNRTRAVEDWLKQHGDKVPDVIQMPKYKVDKRLKVDREDLGQAPPSALYMGLGWDEDSKTQRKHYRQYYTDELENIDEIFPVKSPFHTIEIKKGQSRGVSKGLFSSLKKKKKDESGQDSTEKVVGFFKGIVEVERREARYDYDNRKAHLVKDLIDKVVAIQNQHNRKLPADQKKVNLVLQKVEDCDALEDPLLRKQLKVDLRELRLDHLHITRHLVNLHSDVIIRRQLMANNKCIIRLYMIEAFNLSSRDNGSPSDPYLILKCNDKTYNERSDYQLDEANPKFMKHYDFEGTFPGSSPLHIEVWDYDDVFGDDLIGATILDLEDRYFSLEWQSLHDKPIEYRQIYHQSSSLEQGVVKCWCEINSTTIPATDIKIWDIQEKPMETFEIRICVFNAKDMKIMDWEGTSDVFFRGFFDTKEDVQETDTHFRNQDGKPDFQYRLVYRIQVPRKDYKFSLQAYDRDFFKSNDMIGEAAVNLKQIIEDCSLVKKPLTLNQSYYKDVLKPQDFQPLEFDDDHDSRFWLKLRAKNAETGKEETNGKVKVQVDVLPVATADKNPVGKARDSPNHSPSLPQPEGRIKLSLNPFTMFNQMIGPEVRRKICCFLCLAVAIVLTFALLPTFAGSFVSQVLFACC